MLNKKKWKVFLSFLLFLGTILVGFSGFFSQSVKIFVNAEIRTSNKIQSINSGLGVFKFKDQNNKELFVSLRSNPMNNFVSLTTTKIGSGDIKEQFTYVLCDTATSPDKIKYGKNSGVVKLDYNGNILALWTLPETGKGQENEYIYTTNIVFGDTEKIIYILCGISNPAAALNSFYKDDYFPQNRIIIGPYHPGSESPEDAFYFNRTHFDPTSRIDENSKNSNRFSKIGFGSFNAVDYPKIKIYRLDTNDLTQSTKYDFEFPPAPAAKEMITTGVNALNPSVYGYDIVAGFGGGQYLNYCDENSHWIDGYSSGDSYSQISLMNSSFFHYLLYGQTFDYVGDEQFMMIPKYAGIDPNLGGLYSLVSETTGSVASFSNYPSLYDSLFNYKGKFGVTHDQYIPGVGYCEIVYFDNSTTNKPGYQYKYIDAFGREILVPDNEKSEFYLNRMVVNVILMSVGYFLSTKYFAEWKWPDMKNYLTSKTKILGWMLSTYGFICFSPNKSFVFDKYKLYVLNRDSRWKIPLNQFIFDNMIISKDKNNNKRYRFLIKTCFDIDTDIWNRDCYYNNIMERFNADGRYLHLFGAPDYEEDPSIGDKSLGFTWQNFAAAYGRSLNNMPVRVRRVAEPSLSLGEEVLTGISSAINKAIVRNACFSLYVVNKDKLGDIGWRTESDIIKDASIETGEYYGKYASSSGSRYINYGDKIIISDPLYLNKIIVVDSKNFSRSIKKNYDASLTYNKMYDSPETFNRISNLFVLPDNKGFGYLTYKNELKISSLTPDDFIGDKQLSASDFNKNLFSDSQTVVQSVIPVGNSLFVTVSENGNSFLNKVFSIDEIIEHSSIAWLIIVIIVVVVVFIGAGFGGSIWFVKKRGNHNYNLKKNGKVSLNKSKPNKKIKKIKKVKNNNLNISVNQHPVLVSIPVPPKFSKKHKFLSFWSSKKKGYKK